VNDKLKAAEWARQTLESNPLFLDTETTGLMADGEIVQISVIDTDGRALVDTLVKPTRVIPQGAINVHGITNAMVADAPFWEVVLKTLKPLLAGRLVVIYNADYDIRIMANSSQFAGLRPTIWGMQKTIFTCAMEAYASFYGDWNDYHHSYRWQKLINAIRQQALPDPDAPAHSALGDCLRTLAVVKAMAAYQPKAVQP
jgi:DNA polymerase III epsilon subunit-like protein